MATVIRYVATYVNRAGQRTLMTAAQGRYTHETASDAQAWLDAVTNGQNGDRVRSIWGEDPQFDVRPCECWPEHFDPIGVWFDRRERLVQGMLADMKGF